MMNSFRIVRNILSFGFLLCIVSSCSNEAKFIITGEVKGASDTTIYLEKRELSGTVIIDSVKIKDNGEFKFKSSAPLYPDLYALRLGKSYINLGVDSVESINIIANAKSFATDYTVSGSQHTEDIKAITLGNYKLTSKIDALSKLYDEKQITPEVFTDSALIYINEYKKVCVDIIAKDPQSIAAYYAVFQKINGNLLFDPYDRKESKYYGAVATQWDEKHAESPRAKHLKEFALIAMKTQRSLDQNNSILESLPQQQTVDLLDISLPGIDGQITKLSNYKGRPIVLDFTSYLGNFSPAHNTELYKVYEKYKSDVIIYQISVDPDMHNWKNTAVNLPWICVWDKQSTNSNLLNLFNVQQLPTTYIIDKQGDLVKRVLPQDRLDAEIAKVL